MDENEKGPSPEKNELSVDNAVENDKSKESIENLMACLDPENEIPAPAKRVFMSMMRSSSPPAVGHPVLEKLTEDHIHKIIDYSQRDEERAYNLRSSNRWFYLVFVILGLGTFLYLIKTLLPANKDLLVDIIKMFIAFLGGLGSGYGLKTYIDKK
jgi:hypothetical protein